MAVLVRKTVVYNMYTDYKLRLDWRSASVSLAAAFGLALTDVGLDS